MMIKHSGALPKSKYAHLSWSPIVLNTKNWQIQVYKTEKNQTDRQRDKQTDRQTCSHEITRAASRYEQLNKHDHNVESYITRCCRNGEIDIVLSHFNVDMSLPGSVYC